MNAQRGGKEKGLALNETAARPEFLRSLIESMQDGVSVVDMHGTRVLVNQALCDMTGFSAEELMTGGPPFPCWPPECVPALTELYERTLRNEGTPLETTFERKNGERFPVLLRPALVTDAAGEPIALIGTISDLSEAKRNADALRASEQRWRSIVENPFDFVAIIDRDYKYRFMNRTEPGVELSDMIGKRSPLEFVDPEHRARVKEVFDTAFKTGRSASYNAYVPRFDCWYTTVVGPIQGSAGVCELSLLSRDITDAKRADEAQRRSERRLALALEGVHDGLVERDLVTGEHYYSPRLYKLFGFEPGDPALSIGPDGILERIHPQERSAITAALQHSLQGGEPFDQELRARMRDGSYRWFSARGRSVFEDGQRRFVGFFTDITERKQAEEQRRAMLAERQQAQRLEASGTLAGGIAHDFNNLLTPIMVALELAQANLHPQNEAYTTVTEAIRATGRAKQLTRQVLTFARNDDARLEAVDIVELVEEELRLQAAAAPSLALQTHYDTPSAPVLGDRAQLQQIIANLLTNAQQAMHGMPGRVRVNVEHVELDAAELMVDSSHAVPGTYVRVSVSDQGVGMSENVKRRLFEPFFTTKPVGKGTGLGLAVVHGVVARHGGYIRVSSEPGAGATFEVYLPASSLGLPHSPRAIEKPQSPSTEPFDDVRASPAHAQVLLVDDDPAVLTVTKRVLEMSGYKVTCTSRAREALEWLRAGTKRFDLVITDFAMPELSGLDLAQQIRRLHCDLPVILITGYADGLPESGNPAGIDAILHKPYRSHELLACLERCLAAAATQLSAADQRSH